MSNLFKAFEQQIRLEKSEIKELEQKLRDKDKLIIELADALVRVNYAWPNDHDAELIRRAREETK